MNPYSAPLADLRFALHDVLGADEVYARLPGCAAAGRDVIDAVLEEAGKFAEQVLAPLNQSGDAEGCSFDAASHSVRTPKGFKEAFTQYVDSGWIGLTAEERFGGQGLPETLGAALKEMIDAANLSWGNYPMLSHGAASALEHHGEDWQREVFLRPLVAGRWTGTMCLTEPHCGTDLGLLKTRAEAAADGSYRITGTKIFITAGEHDFVDNILHLVLARLPDAPAGVKGISLFLVPKFKVGKDGQVGARNGAACGSIEHKMGIHGSVTCVMNFDDAQGWLVGQPNKGLAAMFTMMNTARLAVGLQGLGLIERAYQNALRYARERLQMRALSGARFPDKPADPLIVHGDVRRMLLTQKAFAEGGRLLGLYAYLQEDIRKHGTDAAERERAEALVSFLTPIVKGLLTEAAIECTYEALQIFGGHGFIVENGMEQYARDARITTLYEGTTQIQANDLLGRKVLQLKGVGLRHFLDEIGAFCKTHAADAQLAEFIGPLGKAAGDWGALSLELGQRAAANIEEVGAAAWDYLHYSGYIALAYLWARSVAAAAASAHGSDFKQAKRLTARFYYARILPRIHTHAASIRSGAAVLHDMSDAQFG
ncbi:MAG: acyl-CoA dehydrogenase C-terminal domain-containing protein [Dokdonella sp.]|uniref:acyl-CoA dehydrogenase C-terminal domain-containing protein n=1 Tax=Dokdonella sp. TaxID=2291710 RepID=UPI0025C0306C|nr:acyl-CoA dehydrogenase C-terminal domain-containing protein [Dokdonella sp.]MBX3701815.1 acyl-CoA dehydrogenase C-terminal domain-containing protein [Dokdonella sp.]MCW5577812.1 acyl-CoA dehydrogenase C-terminal domain-containing protein [Dokdonella sp.]